MDPILRGDVRLAGTQPVLVLSHGVFNERSGTVIAMAVTDHPQKAGFPLTLEVCIGKTAEPSWVKTGQIRTFSADRIGRKITRLDHEIVTKALEGLQEIIG